ncbi:MAG: hypothetical protein U1E36_05355 [Rickettsiales bacterium]
MRFYHKIIFLLFGFFLQGMLFAFSANATGLLETTPAIFKETRCFGSVTMPPKPGPIQNPPIDGFIPPGIVPPCLPKPSCSIAVGSSGQLQSALNSTNCGCEIVVAGGSYSGAFQASKACTLSNPLVVRSASPQAAVLRSQFTLSGSGTYVSGFTVTGGSFQVNSGKENVIIGNRFTTPGDITVGGGGASSNQIVYNHFDHTIVPGIDSTGAPGDANILFNLRPNDNPQNQNNVVAFNHFDSGNVWGIWVGTYDLESRFEYIYRAQTLISNNLWTNWQGKDALEIKSHSNIVQYNTIVGGRAKLLNRNGSYSKFIANYIEGSTGIDIYDNNHFLLGNKVISSSIKLMANGYVGTAERAEEGKGLRKGADNSQLIGNTGPLILGFDFGDLKSPSAVKNLCIQDHTGPITNGNQGATGTRTTCGWTGPVPEARKLSPGEVGTIRFVGGNTAGCSSTPSDPVDPVDPGPEPDPETLIPCKGTFALGPDYTQGWAVHKIVGSASVTQEPNGLLVQSGPVNGSGEGTGGVALWSKCLKASPWRVEFDYTQLDATATTNGNGVFSQFAFSVLDKDIAEDDGPEFATPAVYTSYEPTDYYYADLVTGYRISFDTFNTLNPSLSNAIRMRQFNANGERPPIDPVSAKPFPFTKDVTYHVTVMRNGGSLTVTARDPSGGSTTQTFSNGALGTYQNGFFGFRFSEGKRARISNFTVN